MAEEIKVIPVEIDGKQALRTLQDMEKEVSALAREMKKLPVEGEAFKKKAEEFGKAKATLAETRAEASKLAQGFDLTANNTGKLGVAAKGAVGELAKMSPLSGTLGQFSGVLGSITSAAGSGSKGFQLLRMSMLALPIFLIIAAVAVLIGWFTKFDEGMKFIDKASRVLTATIDLLLNKFVNIGETIKQLTSNPMGFFSDMGKEIEQSVKAADELVEALDALDDRRRAMELSTAQNEVAIKKALLGSRDINLSLSARLKLLDEANKMEAANHEAKVSYAAEALRLQEIEAAEQLRTLGEVSDAMKDKIVDAKKKVLEAEGESIELQQTLQKRRISLINEEEAAHAAAAKKRADRLKELAKIEEDGQRALQDLKNGLIGDQYDRERAQATTAAERQIEDLKARGQLRADLEVAIRQTLAQRLAAIDEEERLSKEQKGKDAADKAFSEGMARITDESDIRKAELTNQAMEVLDIEKNKQALLLQIEEDTARQKLAFLMQSGRGETAEARKIAAEAKRISLEKNKTIQDNDKKTQELKKQLLGAEMGLLSTWLEATIEFLGQDEATRKQYGGAIKGLSIAKVVTDGVQEVQAIWLNANSNPMNALIPGFGTALAIAQTALTVARSTAAISKISSTQYAKGGLFGGDQNLVSRVGGAITNGPSHAQGGIPFLNLSNGTIHELEGREVILSGATYDNNREIVDQLLASSLWSGGVSINRFANGGIMSGASSTPVTSQISMAPVVAELQALRAEMSSFSGRLHAEVVYEQSSKVDTEAIAARKAATFS